MLFSSMIFVFAFLPILILVYFAAKPEIRNYILCIFSMIFYAWGEPKFVIMILISIVLNYSSAALIGIAYKKDNSSVAKFYLIINILINIGLLFYFKYFNFFMSNINSIFEQTGINPVIYNNVVLPLGISFFTFQAMSYVIDVYRKETEVNYNIWDVALYISFFPQLIAGPIVRYVDVEKEIKTRTIKPEQVASGVRRFIMGLAKKMLLANPMGSVADAIFNQQLNSLTSPVAWLGILCYSFQIYYDFSAYSDMAIGLAKIFGFNFLENFNYPYISKSITEFWRRWHMSLSSWFRDYVYIPLGGNRKGVHRTYLNLLLVFTLTGIWHGAGWNFLLWGLFHGMFLIIEKTKIVPRCLNKFNIEIHPVLSNIMVRYYTLLVVAIAWVLFRADTLTYGVGYIQTMFGLKTGDNVLYSIGYYMNNKNVIALIVSIVLSMPIKNYLTNKFKENKLLCIGSDFVLMALFIITTVVIATSTYNPFIYFRF